MPSRPVTILWVARKPGILHRGRLRAGPLVLNCALGRSGIVASKREGDGASPRGRLRVLGLYYRADAMTRPNHMLDPRPVRRDQGWCDAPGDRNYNRPVRLPYPASHEQMWRPDHLYDLVVDLDWNRSRRAAGRGSAIFMHLAQHDYSATAGCIALTRDDWRRLLPLLGRKVWIVIG